MHYYWSRLTSSARGQKFNPLTYPFLFATMVYGAGFLFLSHSPGVADSSLHAAMASLGGWIPAVWGAVALGTIIVGVIYLLFHKPPAGRLSGLLGFMVWCFAVGCWLVTGAWLAGLAVGVPNLFFWVWQYLSLSVYRDEDRQDKATMEAYDRGEYDDDNGGRQLRLTNRGVDRQ